MARTLVHAKVHYGNKQTKHISADSHITSGMSQTRDFPTLDFTLDLDRNSARTLEFSRTAIKIVRP